MKWRYVKENVVYNKNSGEDIGSVNMGDLNDQVLEQQQACINMMFCGGQTYSGIHGQKDLHPLSV